MWSSGDSPGADADLRGLLWMTLPSWGMGYIQNFLLTFGTLAACYGLPQGLRSTKDGAAFDLAFAAAVGVVALVSFHSLLHDFSLMILPLLVAGGVLRRGHAERGKSAYTRVTMGFILFLHATLFRADFYG